jgi:molybdenum cofactor guanylyltransferase
MSAPDLQSAYLTGIILAGGASSRMGSDKRRLRLWGDTGPTLLEHQMQQLQRWIGTPIVVLNDAHNWLDLPAHLVADATQCAGPLAGLIAGLQATPTAHALVVACDMPWIALPLVQLLAALCEDYAAVVPLTPYQGQLQPEPLLAIYQRSCLTVAEQCLANGERRLQTLLQQLHVRYVTPDEWHDADPEGRSFRNLNRPGDLYQLGSQGDGVTG